MKTLIICLILAFMNSAMASQHQHLGSIGSSAKGQFIALEEYGYKSETHSYYVTIRIINVWTSEDVGSTVEVETPAKESGFLQVARQKAKALAQNQLTKFKIISI